MTKAQDSQSNKIMETVRKDEEIVESYTVTKLTRKQIYDEVWSISISGMANKYDISYSLLWKQIKNANIPIPPKGYWTKKEFGKETVVEELKGNPDEVVELCKRMPFISKSKDDTKILAEEKAVINTLQAIIENEVKENDVAISNYSGEYDALLPFLSIEEKEQLYVAVTNVKITDEKERLHSKIIAHRKRIESWEKEFKKQTPYQQRQSKNTAPYLKYDVADNSLPRVFRIIDSLIKAMKPLGVDLDDNLCFHYKTDYIKLSFSEATTEMPHELTKEERMSLLKYEDERKRYSWASKPQIRKYDHIHNGRISVGVGLKRKFRDGKFITLEEQLGDMMIAIFIAINDAKLAREEREEAERKRQEEQRKRERLRERYNEEVELTLALENQAEDFAMACKIRALINEVESKSDKDNEIAEWIMWARAKADWYDPTVAAKDEFFGEREHEKSKEQKKLEKRYYW